MKRSAVLCLAWASLAGASPPEPPPVPAHLQPYISDGLLDPKDYAWMRGAFADASPEDKAATAAADDWATQCLAAGVAKTRAELAAMGIADPQLDAAAGAPLLCRMYLFRPQAEKSETFAQFEVRRDEGLPVARTYLMATLAARESNKLVATRELPTALLARPLIEQMLRRAMSWGQGEMKDAPPLSLGALAIFQSRLGMEMVAEDHANTEWLKDIVETKGWPRISDVGKLAASQAWLMAQHADADPVFQYKVLRLMEPMVAEGEVSKTDFAYLYDRVMLKLNGKQRYATQMTCQGGKRTPQPMEDEDRIDDLRVEMGMPPLASYVADMDRIFGPCPPG